MSKTNNIDPNSLLKNSWNSNVVSPENEKKIDHALKKMGFFKPIVVRELEDGRLQILGGQHRCESAIRLGLKTVPIFNVGKVDDIRAKEISIADNARYGSDDAVALAGILDEISKHDSIEDFLPFTETDIAAIFSSLDINLDELELDENSDEDTGSKPEPVEREPKTHTIMRFKVTIQDAEKITDLITRIQKDHGYKGSDELTNAGDALVHVIFKGLSNE